MSCMFCVTNGSFSCPASGIVLPASGGGKCEVTAKTRFSPPNGGSYIMTAFFLLRNSMYASLTSAVFERLMGMSSSAI